jgi:hypothetical protein
MRTRTSTKREVIRLVAEGGFPGRIRGDWLIGDFGEGEREIPLAPLIEAVRHSQLTFSASLLADLARDLSRFYPPRAAH